jgi:hypothetical protein
MKISQVKKEKISEQILSVLFNVHPNSKFTAEIARDIARDEEFIKAMMFELKEKLLVVPIKKNSHGNFYVRRIRWRLSNKAYDAYTQLS